MYFFLLILTLTHFVVGGSLNLLVLITAHKKAGQQVQTSSRTNIQFLVFHLTLADTIVSLGSLTCLRCMCHCVNM